MSRLCDRCVDGMQWIPVGEFGERMVNCWKCGGSGILPEPALVNPSAFEMDFHTRPGEPNHTNGSI